MQLLGFACIRDCSVCPFACNRGFESRVVTSSNQISQNLPKAMENSIGEKSSKPELKDNVPTDTKDEFKESEMNLPVLADVQYEIKDSVKKGLFGWRKNK